MYHDERQWRYVSALRTPWQTPASRGGGAWLETTEVAETLAQGYCGAHAKEHGGAVRATGGGCEGLAESRAECTCTEDGQRRRETAAAQSD
jgi:hypothetical protein